MSSQGPLSPDETFLPLHELSRRGGRVVYMGHVIIMKRWPASVVVHLDISQTRAPLRYERRLDSDWLLNA